MNTSSYVVDLEDENIQYSLPRGHSGGVSQRPNTIHPQQLTIRSAKTTPSKPQQKPTHRQKLRQKLLALLHPSKHAVFVTACAIAVSLDPLFFYIPFVNEDKKCLDMDVKLKNIALVLRTIFDLTFVVHLVDQIRVAMQAVREENAAENPAEDQDPPPTGFIDKFFEPFENLDSIVDKLKWRSFITDILCVLPVPQVLLVVVFYRMKVTGYLDDRRYLNFFLLIQYVARLYRIYLSSKEFVKKSGIWVKGLFNFFLFLVASHVFGAFWYFFAIQRETSCWHRHCDASCKENYNFYCTEGGITDAMNTTIQAFTPVCVPKADPQGDFNFGIFVPVLTSGHTTTKDFLKKLLFCFWWGLSNLSNFGTNLTSDKGPSNYPWEILFVVFVSLSGLLIFLYLIGNVQTYMSMKTQRIEEVRQKMESTKRDLEEWMSRNAVDEKLKEVIMENIEKKLEDDLDASMENLFSVLSFETKKELKRHLCLSTLKKIPGLKDKDEGVVKMICDYLKPATYTQNEMFATAGDPAERMIIISEGSMWILNKSGGDNSSHGRQESPTATASSPSTTVLGNLKKNQFYGHEQLLTWAATGGLLDLKKLPSWPVDVRCHTAVDGFTLSAQDLQTVVHRSNQLWKKKNPVSIVN